MKAYETVGGLIKTINEALERDCNNDMRESGLTLSQLNVLMPLADHPEGRMTMKEIERVLRCTQPTVHGLVSRLAEKGLIETGDIPEDRRIRVVRITQKGRLCCLEAKEHMLRTEEKLLEGLGREEREALIRSLVRIRDTLV